MEPGTFEEHRALLFSIAYRMLGSVTEAEDVVQDVYLRTASAEARDPKAFLVTAATRLSIDRLRSAQRRRETYVGPWLPEPLVGAAPDPAEDAVRDDSLSLAVLLLLESLSPPERAAFLLHDVFAFSYTEVAGALGRTEAAARQLVHRARRALDARRSRYEVSRREHRALLERFLAACSGRDLEGLAALLAEEAVAITDGGGEVQAARRPVHGRRRVARLFVYLAGRLPSSAPSEIVSVNGRDGILLLDEGLPLAILDLAVTGKMIERVHVVVAPSKLSRVRPRAKEGRATLILAEGPPA
jgi:RNA polymerase sigma-70 factor (ECF subfamily)